MVDFRVIADALKMGSAPKVKKMVAAALEEGAAPVDILNNSLVVGMSEIGTLFKNNEVYVPEVLIAARDEGGHGHNKAAYDSRPCGDGGQGRNRHGKGRPARHRQKPRRDDAGGLGLSGDQPGHRRRARWARLKVREGCGPLELSMAFLTVCAPLNLRSFLCAFARPLPMRYAPRLLQCTVKRFANIRRSYA